MGNSAGQEDNLKIKILAGEAHSMELFDFHSPQKQQLVSDLKFPSVIGYSDGEIVYTSEESPSQGVQPVYRIERNNYRDIVIRELFERPQEYKQSFIWKVLAEGELMPLQKGDCIKIGKTKVTFKQIVGKKQGASISKNPTLIFTDREETERMDLSLNVDLAVKVGEGQCRLCFENTETLANPLVSLCKCSGSVKYIHYECLRDWISNNVKKDKSSNCLYYSYTEPNCCELCKEPLQNEFMHEGQKFSLYEFQKIEPPYAVFENRYFDEEANKMRVSVFNISIPENSEISVGRNNNSQVVLRDISVSRTHCFLIYRQGCLYIQDKKSKFGTLVCPKRGFEFDSVHGLQLQLQSKIIQISQDQTFNGCCCQTNSSYFVQLNKGMNDHGNANDLNGNGNGNGGEAGL